MASAATTPEKGNQPIAVAVAGQEDTAPVSAGVRGETGAGVKAPRLGRIQLGNLAKRIAA